MKNDLTQMFKKATGDASMPNVFNGTNPWQNATGDAAATSLPATTATGAATPSAAVKTSGCGCGGDEKECKRKKLISFLVAGAIGAAVTYMLVKKSA